MRGILLVDMGGANSPKELKLFLKRMFKDPFILPFGKLGRNLLSFIISNIRYKKSWKKYLLIGGSPIIKSTEQLSMSLQNQLGNEYKVRYAFSYSQPFINDIIGQFIAEHINNITIIPLYPQSSFSTTSSVAADVKNAVKWNENLKITFIKEFYNHELYLNFWSNLILNHIKNHNYIKPILVFSAHSIPLTLVEKGDTYPKAIEASARLIAEKAGCDYMVAYQSSMSKKWIGPETKQVLKKIAEERKNEIVIIPISFVNENLETLYDINTDIIPFAKNMLGIKNISKVEIPVANEDFINLLKDIVIGK
jgi:ferrochelatase